MLHLRCKARMREIHARSLDLWYGELVKLAILQSRILVASLISISLLAGCATSAPFLHTAGDRAAYEALPPNVRQLVDAGRIEKGMDPETVRLAWGTPAEKSEDQLNDHRLRWKYYGFRWENVPQWYYAFDAYGGYMLDFRMGRRAVPYVRKWVVFENGKVVDWQTLPP